MERVAVDILGPLPLTRKGNKYVLVMVDCFTKWTEAVALPDQEATTIARAFVDTIVCHFGAPLQIHSDQGRILNLNSSRKCAVFFKFRKQEQQVIIHNQMGMSKDLTEPMGDMLSTFCHKNQDQWDVFLPQVLMAYRSSVHSSTGQTPNAMMLGREITICGIFFR